MEEENYIQALIKLHHGLQRLGPGDSHFSRQMLALIPALADMPRIADIGCGSGAGTLLLADYFQARVRAVDFARDFLNDLQNRAKQQGLEHLIETVECDMGSLDWQAASIDLLWSEGAAYNLTFAGALNAWRPFMATHGIAIISELSYFSNDIPEAVRLYWQNGYPAIATEAENSEHAKSSGFEVLAIHRLPSSAWWHNYYGPLKENINAFRHSNDTVMQAVIKDTEEEMSLFEKYEKYYGYSFYILKAV